MRRAAAVSWLLILLWATSPLAAQRTECHPALDSLRAAIPGQLRADKVPGLVLHAVDAHGRTLCDEAFGEIVRGRGVVVTPQTRFSAQSISKVLTATAVLTAVRDGWLELDVPIASYLPELRLQSPHQPTPERVITLRHLLSHRAGLPHEAPVGNNYDQDAADFAAHVASIEHTWLRFPVGQRYSYSNLGFDLAGRVLEARTGQPFAQYVRERVLAPLGMTRTTFEPAAILADTLRAIGHATGFDSIPPLTPMLPSGGAWTTARDLGQLARLHLEHGGAGLLPETLLQEMRRMQQPEPGQVQGYGLGIGVRREGAHVLLEHGGSGFGFRASLLLEPARGIAVAVLANSESSALPGALAEAALHALLATAGASTVGNAGHAPAPTSPPVRELAVHDSTLAGTYLYNGSGIMYVLWQDGKLGVGTPQDFRPFHFVSPDEAYFELQGGRFPHRFVRGAAGEPAHLVRLYDGGWLDYLETRAADTVRVRWRAYEGAWRQRKWGRPQAPLEVAARGGRLFLAHMPLREHLPGLFFTPHGETLDFRGAVPTWRGVALERVH